MGGPHCATRHIEECFLVLVRSDHRRGVRDGDARPPWRRGWDNTEDGRTQSPGGASRHLGIPRNIARQSACELDQFEKERIVDGVT